ncbi:hypothetical protein PB01_08115 [Psychrobacillus glaciei]|uniref:LXG domain-containing protein n=1 Tax=Psychrobacillus glaciei TaxID=2283160 RepID=A0A5J6SLD9_9BACI|nr:hypothetical protein [Psychrobacillus glaciei]QFF98800.1 hypothetical protein PB01_08115 [Psychrobacillus glaciei]
MTTVKESYGLKDLARELDNDLSSIAVKVDTLKDLKTSITNLRIEMDGINERDARVYFMDFHRSIRLIDDLFQHTVNSLSDEFEEVEVTKDFLFNKIVKEQ